jgi:four helix bundle protein
MAKVTRFEELVAWQKARALTATIYQLSASGKFGQDFGLKDQIRRAAVSIMSNIAEGFERCRAGEFHQMLSVAKASCGEVRSQLYVALDTGYIGDAEFRAVMMDAEEVGRIIGGLRSAVQKQKVLS